LQRIDDGRLWWTIDGAMYVYYTPTHWRFYGEAERWEKDSSLSTWFPLTAKEIDDLRSENRVLVARAEEAEAERDAANARLRVMESRMKQVHAALLASMSDEQLAQSVKAR